MFIMNFQEGVIVCFSFTNILDTTYTFYSSCQSSSWDSCFLDMSLGDTSLSISFREDISENQNAYIKSSKPLSGTLFSLIDSMK